MATTVRVFTYSAIITAPVAASSGRFSSDSVGLLKHPYMGRDLIVATTGGAQATDPSMAPMGTSLIRIQVQPGGNAVHYELLPENNSGAITQATTDSPHLDGDGLFAFGPGWTVSILEASF